MGSTRREAARPAPGEGKTADGGEYYPDAAVDLAADAREWSRRNPRAQPVSTIFRPDSPKVG